MYKCLHEVNIRVGEEYLVIYDVVERKFSFAWEVSGNPVVQGFCWLPVEFFFSHECLPWLLEFFFFTSSETLNNRYGTDGI